MERRRLGDRLTRAEYDRQFERIERAITDLRVGGSRLHAIARAYYLVHLTATFVGHHYGLVVRVRRDGQTTEIAEFSHNVVPDVVAALYRGSRSGAVLPGSTPGIVGVLTDSQAVRYADMLQTDRKAADYGPTDAAEPYDDAQTDERLDWAKNLAADLRKIL